MMQFADWFWWDVGDHVATAISDQLYRSPSYMRNIEAPCTTILVNFCDDAKLMDSWEPLADICWRQLRPEVEALLHATFPEMLRAYTERASAYARDAEKAARCAEVYERALPLSPEELAEMTTDDELPGMSTDGDEL